MLREQKVLAVVVTRRAVSVGAVRRGGGAAVGATLIFTQQSAPRTRRVHNKLVY